MDHQAQQEPTHQHKRKAWNAGYVQVYTGNGKGKTTAALGLALRAAGHGLRTYIGQFMKGSGSGEVEAARRLGGSIQIEQYGGPCLARWTGKPPQEEIQRVRDGLGRAREAMLSGAFDIVVLDEVNVAVHFRLLSVEEVLAVIQEKPAEVELICTGRKAPKALLERADLVTQMREAKHYYHQGVGARTGIEQ